MASEDREDSDERQAPQSEAAQAEGPVGDVSETPPQGAPGTTSWGLRQWLIVAVLSVVIAGAVACIVGKVTRRRAIGPQGGSFRQGPSLSSLTDSVRTFGSAEAKVKGVAILPLTVGCQTDRADYLQQAAEAYPDHLFVKLVDIHSVAGREEKARVGLDCAGVVINGKNSFELDTSEGKRTVVLKGPPNTGYTPSDIRAALQQEVVKAYGKDAPQLPQPKVSAEPKAKAH